MKYIKLSVFSVMAIGCASAFAAGGDGLWGWNISAGGNVGFGLKTNLRSSPARAMANMPALHPASGSTRTDAANAAKQALAAGKRVAFNDDKSAFIDPHTTWTGTTETQNWRLPDSAANDAECAFEFKTANGYGHQYVCEDDGSWGRVGEWSEVVASASVVNDVSSGNERDVTWGASVDLSHLLYMSEDGNWGVDIVFGLTWMKSPNCHRSGGTAVRRTASMETGTTDIRVNDAYFLTYADPEDAGWGSGTPDGSSGYTVWGLDTANVVGTPVVGSSSSYADAMYLSSHGDYEEWEIAILLKPWYDVTDWLCIHGLFGVGVTRSSFNYVMDAYAGGRPIYRSSEEFYEWRCYGIAGGGVLFRIWDFDLSLDGVFRWCQDDMDIYSPDVRGTIEKPWAVMRLGLSYAF